MLEVQDYLNLPKLGMEDSFAFTCVRCGRCCRNREDILLTPFDLFKMAKHLNMKIDEVMEQYCESYEGETSKVPVVRIKPREYRKTCPFATKDGCKLHKIHPTAKPSVCALFPLGRLTVFGEEGFKYFLQPATCGNKNQSQTVREWLDEFGLKEHIATMWHKKMGEISMLMRKAYEKANFNRMDINAILLLTLYVFYDLEQDFEPQFERNLDKALEIASHLASVGEEGADGELVL